MYAIVNEGGLRLTAHAQCLSLSELIEDDSPPPTWTKKNGLATSDREFAQLLADRYGGKVVEV